MISSQLQIILLFEFYSANNTNILPDSGNVDLNPHCLLGGFHALQNSSRQLPWQMSCCKQGSPQREVGHQRELCLPIEIILDRFVPAGFFFSSRSNITLQP